MPAPKARYDGHADWYDAWNEPHAARAAPDISALCAACHELSQTGGPLIVVGAGLPHLPSVLSASKSYSERLFRYARIVRLDRAAADIALQLPAKGEDAEP